MAAPRSASTFPAPPRAAPPGQSLPRPPDPFGAEAVVLTLLSAVLAVDFGWPLRSGVSHALMAGVTFFMVPWAGLLLKRERAQGGPWRARVWVFRFAVLALALVLLFVKWWLLLGLGGAEPERFEGASRSYTVALATTFVAGVLGNSLRFSKLSSLVADHPARLVALSFGATGLFGAFVLSLPISVQRVSELSFVDNIFTSFSAVCVTGLLVNNLADTYTLFGQAVVCLLIQIGGMGIMVLSAAILILSGQRMRVKSSAVLAEIVDTQSLSSLRRTIGWIVAGTLAFEALGAVIIYQRLNAHPDASLGSTGALAGPSNLEWAAVFHAVAAFCNAGMSNFSLGLAPFRDDPLLLATLASLVVLGGIGFPVLEELARHLGRVVLRRRRERLSLHTRLCLRVTALLLVGLAVVYVVLERTASFAALGWPETLGAALFHSVSARTAGFQLVDMGTMRAATLMLTCVAMFIGACPGSCGGGIKVTTLAVLFSDLRAELQGRPPHLFDRALSPATTRRAMGVAFLSIGLVATSLFLLLLVEEHDPLKLGFEVFSAFSTAGLSTGITPELSTPGKLLIALTLFVGRIGPLTLALALSKRGEPSSVQLPTERVVIG